MTVRERKKRRRARLNRERFRRYWKKNRKEINRRSRERHAKNPKPRRESIRRCRLKKGLRKARADARKYRAKNLKKWRKYHRQYNKEHPGAPRANHLKRRFGLTVERWEEMKLQQKGKCAICSCKSKLCVDHNHLTGQTRQLLCRKCNCALGLFKDSSEIVQNAFWYLCRHARAGKPPEFDRTD